MTTQSEAQLENQLIANLEAQGYARVSIPDEDTLVANLKRQLEVHNGVHFSSDEFKYILMQLGKGTLFDKAERLRDRLDYVKDDGTTGYIQLFNTQLWCKNQYQVTNQISIEGKSRGGESRKNRYDVTLLINGFPICQIELKRRGLEMKEAFNQIKRYHRDSYAAGHGLFGYVQLFVISNGVNTKYYANNPGRELDFKQTFFWCDEENKRISQLSEFAEVFLEKCSLSKMVARYIVLNQSEKKLYSLRSYQYYAVEAIIDQVINSTRNGYIWHTTGSGKTLTSFKTAQILTNLPKVKKVVFVVDRKDLDFKTVEDFNKFSADSVDGTNNTKALVRQFGDDTPLIVTTLQKLNTAILKERYLANMDALKDEKMVFIFDECHRSQFGETHKRITDYFSNVQLFGFTGTPILVENAAKNALGKRTTEDLFGESLHEYVITDAIRDQNVLPFSVEYIRTFKKKDVIVDIDVEAIDTKEVMDSPTRLEAITDYIIANHGRKTYSREFTAVFCVSSKEALQHYYRLFEQKKAEGLHELKVATIFSFAANEGDSEDGSIDTDISQEGAVNQSSRDALEGYMKDYNAMYGTNYDTNSFYKYYEDIGKRVKKKEVDILLVVNMFLTGFDSKWINTIYVDKNLKYHGLIQAFSRTNRTNGIKKQYGNVVCFRNLKPATDKAIELFANKEAESTIILAPYEDHLKQFEEALTRLKEITPSVDSVDELLTEEDELAFITAFRALMRAKNALECFSDFSFEDTAIDEQEFVDYASKYHDLREKVNAQNKAEKVSILDDIDFELELITRDTINVSYIIRLLAELVNETGDAAERKRKAILNSLQTERQLHSKRELIEQFINTSYQSINDASMVEDAFESFWEIEKKKAISNLCEEESLDPDGLDSVLSNYLFTEKAPLRDDVIGIMTKRPGLRERKTVAQRVIEKIVDFVETFIDGIA
ncbi:MAG: type I restriction endonuclease subunit R [Gammaproteobacteria bacterium]|nr:type I restriction endonuclease subunit R [Gammaproteobacteria bacterium]